jgi:hypothetical protein
MDVGNDQELTAESIQAILHISVVMILIFSKMKDFDRVKIVQNAQAFAL